MTDEVVLDGSEPISMDVTPSRDLIAEWVARTVEVRALELAQVLLPDTRSIAFGAEGMCVLVCASRDSACEVYRFLDTHAEDLLVIPELSAMGPRVFVHYHRFSAA